MINVLSTKVNTMKYYNIKYLEKIRQYLSNMMVNLRWKLTSCGQETVMKNN